MSNELQRDGWIAWNALEDAVPTYYSLVQVRLLSGNEWVDSPDNLDWNVNGDPGDIIAWRPVDSEKVETALDTQIGGEHYKNYAIQPVEFITKNKLGFLESCVIKRICRYENKNGLKDLKKAKHEIDLLIELKYGCQA